ncbi:hypothetical protein HK102_002071, partial [Quaeritorhiza haematococci]
PPDVVRQVELDINRSLSHWLPEDDDELLHRRRNELKRVVLGALGRHPCLHYYQGFHDVCSCLLLVLGERLAVEAAEAVSLFWLRDSMQESMEGSLRLLSLLLPLLECADPSVHSFLTSVDGFLPYFCLSWVITWFSHDVDTPTTSARLFDLFIASNPALPVYVAGTMVLQRRKALLNLSPEFSEVHQFLSSLQIDGVATLTANFDIDDLLEETQQLFAQYPPSYLTSWRRRKALVGKAVDGGNGAVQLGPHSCVNRYKADVDTLGDVELLNYAVAEEQLQKQVQWQKRRSRLSGLVRYASTHYLLISTATVITGFVLIMLMRRIMVEIE